MGNLNQDESYFKVFLDSVFQVINKRKVTKLIIDVRDNGGGEDHNGSLLYSFLTNKPFAYYSSLSTISQQLSKEVHSNLEIQKPQTNNFKGKCYFLINGRSFSTTSEFTAIAKVVTGEFLLVKKQEADIMETQVANKRYLPFRIQTSG